MNKSSKMSSGAPWCNQKNNCFYFLHDDKTCNNNRSPRYKIWCNDSINCKYYINGMNKVLVKCMLEHQKRFELLQEKITKYISSFQNQFLEGDKVQEDYKNFAYYLLYLYINQKKACSDDFANKIQNKEWGATVEELRISICCYKYIISHANHYKAQIEETKSILYDCYLHCLNYINNGHVKVKRNANSWLFLSLLIDNPERKNRDIIESYFAKGKKTFRATFESFLAEEILSNIVD